MATWIQADVLNTHAGGAYGDKRRALARLARRIEINKRYRQVSSNAGDLLDKRLHSCQM
ncbi:MAG: hypothetical protein PVF29_17215 [Desulfobacterales bacterium]